MGDVGVFFFFFFFFLGVFGWGGGMCFCQKRANHKAPRSCNELTNGGIKCAMNRPLQNSPLFFPPLTHCERERERQRQRGREERGTQSKCEVCVVRSQMCVLWVNRGRGGEGAATNWLRWNSGFVSPAALVLKIIIVNIIILVFDAHLMTKREWVPSGDIFGFSSSIQEGGTGERASVAEAFRLLLPFFFPSHCVVSREEGKLLLSAGFLKIILLICFCFVCVCVCVCVFFCSGGLFQFLIWE